MKKKKKRKLEYNFSHPLTDGAVRHSDEEIIAAVERGWETGDRPPLLEATYSLIHYLACLAFTCYPHLPRDWETEDNLIMAGVAAVLECDLSPETIAGHRSGSPKVHVWQMIDNAMGKHYRLRGGRGPKLGDEWTDEDDENCGDEEDAQDEGDLRRWRSVEYHDPMEGGYCQATQAVGKDDLGQFHVDIAEVLRNVPDRFDEDDPRNIRGDYWRVAENWQYHDLIDRAVEATGAKYEECRGDKEYFEKQLEKHADDWDDERFRLHDWNGASNSL